MAALNAQELFAQVSALISSLLSSIRYTVCDLLHHCSLMILRIFFHFPSHLLPWICMAEELSKYLLEHTTVPGDAAACCNLSCWICTASCQICKFALLQRNLPLPTLDSVLHLWGRCSPFSSPRYGTSLPTSCTAHLSECYLQWSGWTVGEAQACEHLRFMSPHFREPQQLLAVGPTLLVSQHSHSTTPFVRQH